MCVVLGEQLICMWAVLCWELCGFVQVTNEGHVLWWDAMYVWDIMNASCLVVWVAVLICICGQRWEICVDLFRWWMRAAEKCHMCLGFLCVLVVLICEGVVLCRFVCIVNEVYVLLWGAMYFWDYCVCWSCCSVGDCVDLCLGKWDCVGRFVLICVDGS